MRSMPPPSKKGRTFQKVRRAPGEPLEYLRARIPASQKAFLEGSDPEGKGNISRALHQIIREAMEREPEEEREDRIRRAAARIASENQF
jgi:hypothetical protein